jgi:hypothetical protein
MIPIPPAVRVWIATGHTDMRRGRRMPQHTWRPQAAG